VVGDGAHGAVRRNREDHPVAAVDEGGTVRRDRDLVPPPARPPGEIAVGHEGSIDLAADDALGPARDDEEPTVGKPVDTQREGVDRDGHVGVTRRIEGEDLAGSPVAAPNAIVMPTHRLAEDQSRRDLLHRSSDSWPFVMTVSRDNDHRLVGDRPML